MLDHIKRWIKQSLTEPDNKTVCPVRLMSIAGVVQYLGLSVAHYVQHGIFEAQAYAIGFGTLLGGIGVALGLKKDSPPQG